MTATSAPHRPRTTGPPHATRGPTAVPAATRRPGPARTTPHLGRGAHRCTYPTRARRPGATRVTLLTEGTYPHSHGGVSVWCDQLVRGMPDIDFDVIAVTGTGREPVAWELPPMCAGAVASRMWGARARPGRAPARPRPRADSPAAYERFLTALLDPAPRTRLRARAVRAGRAAATAARSRPALRTGPGRARPGRVWNRPRLAVREARPTLHDALTATDLLEHALRPLAARRPERGVAHAVSGGSPPCPASRRSQLHGVPLLLTEHGVYLRERYLGYRTGPYRWPVKALLLGFFRLLAEESYRAGRPDHPRQPLQPALGGARRRRPGADPHGLQRRRPGRLPARRPRTAGAHPQLGRPGRPDQGPGDPDPGLRPGPRPNSRTRGCGCSAAHRAAARPTGSAARRSPPSSGTRDAVTFEGRVDDIRDAYAAGNVVMLSSISEGFPFTLIEAMSCGRATVSTDVGGVREAVGDTGLVVPPRDPAAMAAAALELLRDPRAAGRRWARRPGCG